MTKETYQVTVDRPKGVSVQDMKDYIDDALNSWWGQFEPPGCDPKMGQFDGEGDPRWGLEFRDVKRVQSK